MNEDMMTESERTSTLTDPTLGATTGRGKGVFYVHTLGCQMNVHDSERIAGVLEDDGYIPATEEQAADKDVDLIIMNTCAVRENAAERMYGTIGLWADLKRTHPNMQIAIGGCMAQLDRKRIPHGGDLPGRSGRQAGLFPQSAAGRPCFEGVELGVHLDRLQQHVHVLYRAHHAWQGA